MSDTTLIEPNCLPVQLDRSGHLGECNLGDLEDTSGINETYWLLAIKAAREAGRQEGRKEQGRQADSFQGNSKPGAKKRDPGLEFGHKSYISPRRTERLNLLMKRN